MKSPGQALSQLNPFADHTDDVRAQPPANPGAHSPLQQLFDAALKTPGPASIADSGRNAAEAMTAAEDGRIPTLDLAPPRPGGAGDVLGQMLSDPQKRQALLAMLRGG